MSRLVLAVAVLGSVLLSGVAVAAVVASSPHPPNPSEGRPSARAGSSDAATTEHGGPIDRFHVSGSCGLTSVSALPNNWTHGDYVSAVAMATADSTVIVQAAQSDCGKPMVAVTHAISSRGLPSEAAPQGQDHASANVGVETPGGLPGS